jgi:hypothetical protein
MDGKVMTSNGIEKLIEAVKGGDINRVMYVLEGKPYLKMAGGSAALCVAIDLEQENIVKFLLDRGAKVNSRDVNNTSPIHIAALTGNIKIAEMLLQHGADINAVNSQNESALYDAAREGHAPMIEFLFKNGIAYPHNKTNGIAKDSQHYTPLQWASHFGHVRVVEILLRHGADPNEVDFKKGIKPFKGPAPRAQSNSLAQIETMLWNHLKVLGASSQSASPGRECEPPPSPRPDPRKQDGHDK